MSVSKILIDNRDKNYISKDQIQYLLEIEALTVLRKSGIISDDEYDSILNINTSNPEKQSISVAGGGTRPFLRSSFSLTKNLYWNLNLKMCWKIHRPHKQMYLDLPHNRCR